MKVRRQSKRQTVPETPQPRQETQALEPLLTAAEVAKILRLSRTSVYELARRGLLRTVTLRSGLTRAVRRWRKSDVRDFIEAHIEGDGTDRWGVRPS